MPQDRIAATQSPRLLAGIVCAPARRQPTSPHCMAITSPASGRAALPPSGRSRRLVLHGVTPASSPARSTVRTAGRRAAARGAQSRRSPTGCRGRRPGQVFNAPPIPWPRFEQRRPRSRRLRHAARARRLRRRPIVLHDLADRSRSARSLARRFRRPCSPSPPATHQRSWPNLSARPAGRRASEWPLRRYRIRSPTASGSLSS